MQIKLDYAIRNAINNFMARLFYRKWRVNITVEDTAVFIKEGPIAETQEHLIYEGITKEGTKTYIHIVKPEREDQDETE